MSDKQLQNSETLSKDEQQVQGMLQRHLDAEVDSLDFNVVSKLAAARHRAMEQCDVLSGANTSDAGSPIGYRWLRLQTMAAGVAVVALVMLVGNKLNLSESIPSPAESTRLTQSNLIEDLNLLNAGDDIEFYQSMKFLEWMESQSG